VSILILKNLIFIIVFSDNTKYLYTMKAELFIKKLIELLKEYNRSNGVIISQIDISPTVATYEDGTFDMIGCDVKFKAGTKP
jgi:hypothetical protein